MLARSRGEEVGTLRAKRRLEAEVLSEVQEATCKR